LTKFFKISPEKKKISSDMGGDERSIYSPNFANDQPEALRVKRLV
jgi:hypothetical protein